jgi:hypothetical protein
LQEQVARFRGIESGFQRRGVHPPRAKPRRVAPPCTLT